MGLATPTETYIIQNHDRCTDDEVKEGAGDFEKELSPESNGVVVRRHSKSYSAIPNHCKETSSNLASGFHLIGLPLGPTVEDVNSI